MRVPDLLFYTFFKEENARVRKNIEEKYTEIITGKKLRQASEDPTTAYLFLSRKTQLSQLSQSARSRLFADQSLSYADTILAGMEDRLRSLYSVTIRSANELLREPEVKAIGKEFEEALKLLIDKANEKFGHNYLFSGSSLTTEPFDRNTLNYNGSAQSFRISIEEGYTVDAYLPGSYVFGLNVYDLTVSGFPASFELTYKGTTYTVSGNSLEELVQNIESVTGGKLKGYITKDANGNTLLRVIPQDPEEEVFFSNLSNVSVSQIENIFKGLSLLEEKFKNGLNADSGDVALMQRAYEKLSAVRSKIGSTLTELRNQVSYSEEKKLSLEREISELTDTDLAEAISDYERHKLTYDAIMKLFAGVRELTILKYL